MPTLSTQQRNTLESAVKRARTSAEAGAYNALQSLAVNQPEAYPHMDQEQRSLRKRIRAKGRLLGDSLNSVAMPGSALQTITHLTYELAYETWHKMLFARFLESNGLLMHPTGVAVTLEECEELAPEEGYADKWDAAAAYASQMLPAIFRTDDPLMEVAFATNDRIRLEEILDGLETDIFTADDALGWVYQFWQSEAKAAINASGAKIDGARLPAVTQLFTEPYMVHFLIDNTLGAWWVSRNPGIRPPVKFEYLRLTEEGKPAAGTFEGWPDCTAQVTCLDPCMGSGHFVATLFGVLANLRMHEEGLSREEASDRVIQENLHGLELDPRCTQIAAFNLALTAWKFCGDYRLLPPMHLACSGLAPTGKKEDWIRLVDKVTDGNDRMRMRNGMAMLYDHFQLAPELGSLLDPTTIKPDAFTASFDQLQPVLQKALDGEADNEQVERGVMAAGIAKAGELLARRYTLQITNVPYLSSGKQDEIMADYCKENYADARGDLATVFFSKMLKNNTPGGISCSVIPQNWLFLTSYKKFRALLLKNESWSVVARLGPKGFQTPMWDFNVMLISIQHKKPTTDHLLVGLDVSEEPNAAAKDEALKSVELKTVKQLEQLENPDARVVFEEVGETELLSKYADGYKGLSTGDLNRFIFLFWELRSINEGWVFYQATINKCSLYDGKTQVLYWENGEGQMIQQPSCYVKGRQAWGNKGITVSQMGSLPATLYQGDMFDENAAAIIPKNIENLAAIFSFLCSSGYSELVRQIDKSLKVTNKTLVKVPFDLSYWQKVAAEKYPNSLPKPYSNDPTQWLFHGHPMKAETPLQVSVARLLDYRWPAESDEEMELADEARALIQEVKAFDYLSDQDGIVCIPSVNAEPAGADRLRSFLQAVYGSQWSNQTLGQLLTQEGAIATNLEEWLRKEFFTHHCKVFNNRPFIWHVWDGRNDGFSALVNYHLLTKDGLAKLIYTYLGDWIRQCEAKKKDGESGAEGLLSAALKLKEKLEAILLGEAPYDIFVRWKPLAEQPLGWDPDLNDGVRLNVRPFVEAGVLRSKFNVKWGVDRGQNPPGSPWGEVRDNDRHTTLEEKRQAREQVAQERIKS